MILIIRMAFVGTRVESDQPARLMNQPLLVRLIIAFVSQGCFAMLIAAVLVKNKEEKMSHVTLIIPPSPVRLILISAGKIYSVTLIVVPVSRVAEWAILVTALVRLIAKLIIISAGKI